MPVYHRITLKKYTVVAQIIRAAFPDYRKPIAAVHERSDLLITQWKPNCYFAVDLTTRTANPDSLYASSVPDKSSW